MAGNVVPEKRQRYGLAGETGGIAKGILLVLLALAACFGYFYFFTDLLRSKEEVPAQPEVYTSEVKKPLPERPVTLAKVEPPAASSPAPEDKTVPAGGEPPVKPETPPAGKRTPVPEPQPALKAVSGPAKETKAAAAPAPPSAKPGLSSTAAREVKPLEKPKTVAAKPKTDSGKPAVKTTGTEPAKAPEKSCSIPSADRKKMSAETGGAASAAAGSPSGKRNGKVVATGEGASGAGRAAAAAEQKPAGRYTLQIGVYVLKPTMLADKAKLEKAGFPARVATGAKKSEPMNRLLVGEFSSYSSARSELDRLGKSTKGAFMLRESGKFTVYAGSYFSRERAAEEQSRLRGKGFAPVIRSSEVPVDTYTLTSGSFATLEEAKRHAEGLRKLGFKPIPLQPARQ